MKDAAQDAEISKKANKTEFDDAVKAQGVKDAAQDAEISKKANSSDVNAELQKKFNKSDIAQEAGSATDKVMSQKTVSDLLNGKHILLSEDEYDALEVKDSSKIYMIYED